MSVLVLVFDCSVLSAKTNFIVKYVKKFDFIAHFCFAVFTRSPSELTLIQPTSCTTCLVMEEARYSGQLQGFHLRNAHGSLRDLKQWAYFEVREVLSRYAFSDPFTWRFF